MNLAVRHVLLPALATLALVALYYTPLSVIDCVTRGLLALGVAGVAAIGAFASVGMGFRATRRRSPVAGWWILSAAVLTVPLALLLGPLS